MAACGGAAAVSPRSGTGWTGSWFPTLAARRARMVGNPLVCSGSKVGHRRTANILPLRHTVKWLDEDVRTAQRAGCLVIVLCQYFNLSLRARQFKSNGVGGERPDSVE